MAYMAENLGIVLSPLSLGVDISCHAATKYFGGHSDIMFGAAVSADSNTACLVVHELVGLTWIMSRPVWLVPLERFTPKDKFEMLVPTTRVG